MGWTLGFAGAAMSGDLLPMFRGKDTKPLLPHSTVAFLKIISGIKRSGFLVSIEWCLAGIFTIPECYKYLSKALAVRRGPDFALSAPLNELFLRLLSINEKVMELSGDKDRRRHCSSGT
jgi:hypothetical protein